MFKKSLRDSASLTTTTNVWVEASVATLHASIICSTRFVRCFLLRLLFFLGLKRPRHEDNNNDDDDDDERLQLGSDARLQTSQQIPTTN